MKKKIEIKLDNFKLKYSHSEQFWDVYSLYNGGNYITVVYIEKYKMIQYITRNGAINILSKDIIFKCYKEDGSFKKIVEEYEKRKLI